MNSRTIASPWSAAGETRRSKLLPSGQLGVVAGLLDAVCLSAVLWLVILLILS